MNARTLKALKGSIKKWEAIVAGTGLDNGHNNCPLCKLFWFKTDCYGCPVSDRTGHGGCDGTPYDHWFDATECNANPSRIADTPALKAIARKELRFLRSLLPKK